MGITSGFVFRSEKRERSKGIEYEPDILDIISRIQDKNSGAVGGKKVKVYEEYAVSRSFRRGSTTEAEHQNVLSADFEKNQRWRKDEAIGARNARIYIRDHYTDVQLALKAFVIYSKALCCNIYIYIYIYILKFLLYPDYQKAKVNDHTVAEEGV